MPTGFVAKYLLLIAMIIFVAHECVPHHHHAVHEHEADGHSHQHPCNHDEGHHHDSPEEHQENFVHLDHARLWSEEAPTFWTVFENHEWIGVLTNDLNIGFTCSPSQKADWCVYNVQSAQELFSEQTLSRGPPMA
jgi:hypothetical protein